MSLLRKTAHLLTLLACVSLSAWAMGCGDDGTGSVTSDGSSEAPRSEEHTSELQSRRNLVCRLLLEKKKKKQKKQKKK